jgi:cytochrome b561
METTIKNDLSKKYSRGAIVIHWISFLLIAGLIPVGFIMADTEPSAQKILLYRLHMLMGITVFVLTLLRVWFFFNNQRPPKLETGSSLHNKLVVWIENSFYFVLILLSISGILTVILGELGQAIKTADYTLLPKTLDIPPMIGHQILAKILIALLIAHVTGVLNHYLKFKENTLKRILPKY